VVVFAKYISYLVGPNASRFLSFLSIQTAPTDAAFLVRLEPVSGVTQAGVRLGGAVRPADLLTSVVGELRGAQVLHCRQNGNMLAILLYFFILKNAVNAVLQIKFNLLHFTIKIQCTSVVVLKR